MFLRDRGECATILNEICQNGRRQTEQNGGKCMTTLQISMDEELKQSADGLFRSMGLDTATAVRLFLNAAIAQGGIPFLDAPPKPAAETLEALEDARLLRNLHGPYHSAREAVAAMLED